MPQIPECWYWTTDKAILTGKTRHRIKEKRGFFSVGEKYIILQVEIKVILKRLFSINGENTREELQWRDATLEDYMLLIKHFDFDKTKEN